MTPRAGHHEGGGCGIDEQSRAQQYDAAMTFMGITVDAKQMGGVPCIRVAW